VFVRSSSDGLSFAEPARTLDEVAVGHQDRVEAASGDGVITVVFMDSRADPDYAPDRPQGNDADGHTAGPYLDLWSARSTDGGRNWRERRVSSVTTNANLEVYEAGRVAFNGDYPGIATEAGRTYAVWTDNRDVVPAPKSDADGNDTFLPCVFAPADPFARTYTTPAPDDPCFSQGGTDQNIYGAALDGSPRLFVRVRPKRVRAGRRTRLRFVVRLRDLTGRHRIRGARVRFAGSTRRTGRRGVARIEVRFRRPGVHTARVTLPGARRATPRVRVLRHSRHTQGNPRMHGYDTRRDP
jgi:hypothetical protein